MQFLFEGKCLSTGHLPVKWGRAQNVFEISDFPGHLLKVPRNGDFTRRFLGVRMKSDPNLMFAREIHARYINVARQVAKRRPPTASGRLPVAQAVAAVDTPAGPGIIVERIDSAAGELAPSMKDWAEANGVTDELIESLNRFVRDLVRFGVIIGDIKPANVVVFEQGGALELVVVDGVGETRMVAARAKSRALNALFLARRLYRLGRPLGLRWNLLRWGFERRTG